MSEEPSAEGADPVEEGLVPVHPKWFKIGFYLFLLTWLAYLLVETQSYREFEDLLFPYVIGIPIGLLVLLQLVVIQYPDLVDRFTPAGHGELEEGELQQRFETAASAASTRSKAEKERYELVMMAWVIVLPFMMYYVGMGWTLLVYVFSFTWYFVRDVRLAATVTAVVTVFVYVLFIHFLGMIIWTGELGIVDPLRWLDLML